VDIAWKDGKLAAATIRSIAGTACRAQFGDKVVDLKLKPGQSRQLDGALQ